MYPASIAQHILPHLPTLIAPLVPDSRCDGHELVLLNPHRPDEHLGSFRINLDTGRWADFAQDGVRGGDPITFLAYLHRCSPTEAAAWAETQLEALDVSACADTDLGSESDAVESHALLPIPPEAGDPPRPDRYGLPSQEYLYHTAEGQRWCVVRRYDTPAGKEIRAWTYRDTGHWEPKKPPKPWPLYRLDAIAREASALILIAEGEKAAEAASRLLPGVGTTVFNGARAVKDADLSPLTGRDVLILPDADEPGRQYAQDLIRRLQGQARSLRIMDVWALGWSEGLDIADVETLPADWLDQAIPALEWWFEPHPAESTDVRQPDSAESIQAVVEQLAALDPMEYELRRAAVAKDLKIRTSVLDKWVEEQRARLHAGDDEPGEGLRLEPPEPWPIPVEGGALADTLQALLKRHCILPPMAAEALTLFIFHTYCFAAADISPHIVVVSPVKRSGKTTVLMVLSELVCKALRAEDCTVAALFRVVEQAEPTLLIDEADAFARGDEQLRGLLNSSFQRGGGVLRVVGEDLEVRRFKTFAPTVLASIGDLPSTIMDRAIVVRMKRKANAESVEKFRRAARAACQPLRRQLRRWAEDHVDSLPTLQPDMPSCLNDRAMDSWEPLFQIAKQLGPRWERQAHAAAQALSCIDEAADTGDLGLELLADIRSLVQPLAVDKVTSEWLCYELSALEGKPWSSLNHRGPISQMDVSRMLRPFEIRPHQVRIDHRTAKRPEQTKVGYKGYTVEQFADAWVRYLPTPPAALPTRGRLAGDATVGPRVSAGSESAESPESAETSGSDRVSVERACVSAVSGISSDSDPAGALQARALSVTHPRTGGVIAVQYHVETLEAQRAVDALVARAAIIGADTETTGLDPHQDRLRLVQLTDGQEILILDLFRVDPAVLRPLEPARVIFHHASFDLGFLQAVGIHLQQPGCTQLAAAALTHEPMLSLATVAQQYLGVTLNKEAQRSDWSQTDLTGRQLEYAALDALVALDVYQALMQRLHQTQPSLQGWQLVRACLPAISAAQGRGIRLDQARHRALVDDWSVQLERAGEALRSVIGVDVNPDSGTQLSQWLQGNLEAEFLASWPTTATGQLATDRDTLEAFAQVPIVRPLLDYRRMAQRLKTWGEGYQRHLTAAGRLHPQFRLLGARSGRMSCAHPNVQNLPRDPALRACFIAPEGFALVAADFGQIELRIAGLLSDDPVIRAAYAQGQDLHREIVARVTGKAVTEVTDDERKLGKALNFGLLYGAGADTFRTRARVDYGLELTLEEAERFKVAFDQTYVVLRRWQQEQQRRIEQCGYLETPGGRRVTPRHPKACYTEARNYPIQAAAADLQMLAIQRTHAALQAWGVPAYLVNFVHDELVLEVHADVTAEVAERVRDTMTQAFLDLFQAYDPQPLARGVVEVGIGPDYATAK